MSYPTLDEVEKADRLQLCRWYRYLPSPGAQAIGKPEFHDVCMAEKSILDRVTVRMHAAGGFNPAISKALSRR